MAKLRVTAGGEKLLSLVTFFAAAKKVTAAPHRGRANKPTRTQDSPKKNFKKEKKETAKKTRSIHPECSRRSHDRHATP